MSNPVIDIPDSLRDCLPCQQNVVASHLLAICRISKELSSDVDCMQLAEDLKNKKITTQEVIQEIADKSVGKDVETPINKIIHVLDEIKEKE